GGDARSVRVHRRSMPGRWAGSQQGRGRNLGTCQRSTSAADGYHASRVRSAVGAIVARSGGIVPQRYDAVIIGGGHNGLVSAAYLARAGLRTLVLERRYVLGGAAVTEEVFPGFRFSVASYVVSLLRPEII